MNSREPGADVAEVRRVLDVFLIPGQVTELRALEANFDGSSKTYTLSGYFSNADQMIEAVSKIKHYRGLYFIPNPLTEAVLSRKRNRISIAEKNTLARDSDVSQIRWLLIDVDPMRPSGISSSDMEHSAALELSHHIKGSLTRDGWPEPIHADSGNGAHLTYRVSLPVAQSGLSKRILRSLALRFDNDRARVDPIVFNPGRLLKLYGTWVRKGDNTEDRPHRLSKLVSVPSPLASVSVEHLENHARFARISDSTHKVRIAEPAFDLGEWLSANELSVSGPKAWDDGQLWQLRVCPWNAEHHGSAYVGQRADGSIFAGCHHNSCRTKAWRDLLSLFDSSSGPFLSRSHGISQHNLVEARKAGKPQILVPGEHNGLRVGHDALVQHLRSNLPLGTKLFRRGTELVNLIGDPGNLRLVTIGNDHFRTIVDSEVEFVKSSRDGMTSKYVPCSRDIASAALAGLSTDPGVPEIVTFSSTPLWTRDNRRSWKLAAPGYNAGSQHYFDQPASLDSFAPLLLDPTNTEHRGIIDDLLSAGMPGIFQYFPWANKASAVNALAAILTLLMRPAIQSVVPMFACTAPLPRTGKTLLVKAICLLAFGKNPCIQPLPISEEEMRKTLFSMLRSGDSVLVFDNIRPGAAINSAALASFVTSEDFSGRVLGHSSMASYKNRSVVFLTGNNPLFSKELCARILPIELIPTAVGINEQRELPDLYEMVLAQRHKLLSVLHGMIRAWEKLGMPRAGVSGLPGFEEWQNSVCGVLELWGLGEKVGNNICEWRSEGDLETTDFERLLAIWDGELGVERGFTALQILELACRHGLFGSITANSEHGKLVAFSASVLRPLVSVPTRIVTSPGFVEVFRVLRNGSRNAHRGYEYRLQVNSEEGNQRVKSTSPLDEPISDEMPL